MLDTNLHPIAAHLGRSRTRGDFSVRRHAPSSCLRLEVSGVGPVELPVGLAMAQRLVEVARPAPFGYRDETRFDVGVRDTWEIAKSRLKLDRRKWRKALEPHIEAIHENLGLASDAILVAEPDKLLVYGPGQFFSPHKDSARDDSMVGSLQVVLPSKYTGGVLRVEHHGERRSYGRTRRSATDLTLIAFYGDCTHEVTPVTGGYRVVLSHHLRVKSLRGREYAEALRRAAERIDATCCLMLADIHETW